jgi:SAM-dependent methyltransferase
MPSLKRAELSRVPDYASVTETPSIRITHEAMAMQASRYAFAASLCAGKDVLEVACGAGSGLGNFARAGAAKVIGGDCTENLVVHAARHYRGRLNMLRLDAQALPFRSQSFDLIVLFEAIYYLRNPSAFFIEANRVLRPDGQAVICMINCEGRSHNPSPFSTHYPSAKELARSLSVGGFECQLYGGFRIDAKRDGPRLVSGLKRAAISLGLIPKTMKGKERLKRIFLGPLEYAPRELGVAEEAPESPQILHNLEDSSRFKVIYAVGQKRGGNARSV